MRTFRRVVGIGLIAVLVLAVIGWFGLKAFLNSSHARSVAAGRLSDMLGLPVQVDELNVGGGSSSLSFQVLEPPVEGQPPQEVLRVESATADVSVGDLVRQSVAPTEVTLSGVTLTVRIDQDGRVLTRMPKPTGGGGGDIPIVRIENATLRLRQDGRPEFVMAGIRGTLQTKDGALHIDGGSDDPHWGRWAVAGAIDPNTATGRVELTNPAARADMALLSSIPYVPGSTWNHVRVSGTLAAKVSFTLGTEKQLGYRVELASTGGVDVTIADIDATVTDVAGAVRVEGPRVSLIDLKGKLADGSVTVNGDLDFGPMPAVLTFHVATTGVNVTKLPREWGLPSRVAGDLRGKADLEIKVPATGPNEYRGGGAAELDGATVAGLPAEVRLRLRSDGKRYRFDATDPAPPPTTKSRSNGVIVRPPVRNVRQEQPPKPTDEPTTLDATVTLRDVDIAELLTRLEVEVPYRLSGKVTVRASVSIPVAEADRTQSYRFTGTITSPDFGLEGLRIRDLSGDLKYADGKLRLTSLVGKIGDGTLKGSATAAVQPPGEVAAALTLDRVAVGEALKALPDAIIDIHGPVSGTAEFRAPYERLSDPTTFVGSANLRSDELTVYGRAFRQVRLPVTLRDGTATITVGRATVEGIPLTADGSIGLTGPFAFTATTTTTAVETADLQRLVPELPLPFPLAGKLDATAKLTGTISPVAFTAGGTARADELKVGGRGANRVAVEWAADADRVRVSKLSAELFGGSIDGSADVPFAADKAGRFDVTFKDVDAAAVARAVPDVPVRLSGAVSGSLKGTIPVAVAGRPRTPNLDLDLTAPKLTVQGIPAERLTGKIGFADGTAVYQLEGRTLGGSFEVKGRYPSKPAGERGSLRVRGLDLGNAARAFEMAGLAPLQGAAELTLDFANDLSDGTGRLIVRDLRWGDTLLSSQLTAALRVRNGAVEIVDGGGSLAGGLFRARGRIGRRNYINVSVERADPKRLFAPVPTVADNVTGDVTVSLRGRLAPDMVGTGQVVLSRGTLFGLPVSELRVPFDWSHGTGLDEIVVREASGRVGDGRVTGSLTYDSGSTDRVEGKLRFTEVRLGSAVAALGEYAILRQGRVTGTFTFRAAPFRSVDDLSGRLVATLNQTSVQEIPILRQVTPYLSPTGVTAPFQSGELHGKLSRGVFRVDRLALANPSAQLYADGTITLAGRLDLSVVANTGRLGADGRAARLFGLRLPVAGPIPLTLLVDVSRFLSNRTVRLTVTGTTRAPQVRVNTAALVSDEAIRFLLGRYIPALGAGSVLNELDR